MTERQVQFQPMVIRITPSDSMTPQASSPTSSNMMTRLDMSKQIGSAERFITPSAALFFHQLMSRKQPCQF